MGNYLLSVAGLSAAGSLFMRGDNAEPSTWAFLALAVLACVIAVRSFARGVFGPSINHPDRSAQRAVEGRPERLHERASTPPLGLRSA